MISALASNPLFGLALTLLIYLAMEKLLSKVNIPFINPLIASVAIIIILLKFSGISYQEYNIGGNLFTMMITPATVALALPLYQNFDKLKKYFLPVILGTLVGFDGDFRGFSWNKGFPNFQYSKSRGKRHRFRQYLSRDWYRSSDRDW